MSNPFSKYKNHKQLNSYLSCILKIYNSNYEKKTPKLSHIGTIVNKNTSLHIYVECDENKIKLVKTRFVTTHNNVGFARKRAQTISLIERGFERLGLGHKTVVFRGVHT